MHDFRQAFTVLYEDNHLLLVNKKAGILVQGDKTGDVPLVEYAKEYVKQAYQKPGAVFMGLVHRIDRPVSGLVVLAKTSKALERMNKIFQTREVRKTYWAVVEGVPAEAEGTLIQWLKKDEQKNKTTVFSREIEGALRSELSYRLLRIMEGKSLLEVQPLTGRPHQIRAQLASLKCPIVGDLKYGASKAMPDASIMLHARAIRFVHPVKKEEIYQEAPVPAQGLWQSFTN
ncbi:RNA pseudouridine synthase [Cytophagales bacterium LB-30]|uniref:RNA pseudouridine synthase n=2 Tax=Shiella aurantiaca TaxID=3058365 RepID=A0ABT8F2T6_9BACT|nr:RNA pseudouridine synthase [Shiella aurantiaca]